MRRRIARTLVPAFCGAVLVLAYPPIQAFAASPKPKAPPDLAGRRIPSKEEVEALDRALANGKAEEALQSARRFIQRNLELPHSSGLESAVARLAVAETMLGLEEEARWHWAVAQTLLPEPFPASTFAVWGGAGAKLAAWKARSLEEVPEGVAALAPASADYQPPRQISGAVPELSATTRGEPAPKWLRAQLVIDVDGRPREPIAIGPSQRFSFEVLEAMRGWRFEPARRGGVPVPALHLVAINAPAGKPLTGLLGNLPDLLAIEERLRSGKTKGIAGKVDEIWRRALDREEIPFDVQAAILLLRGLAYAAAGQETDGICFAQAAQSFHPPLFDADLSPYGAAGVLLDQNRYGTARAMRTLTVTSDGAVPVEKPILKSQVKSVYSERARQRGLQGRLLLSTVIDENGAVRDPIVFGAGPEAGGLDFASVASVCQWRFAPARRAGQPVRVTYVLTVNFEVRVH